MSPRGLAGRPPSPGSRSRGTERWPHWRLAIPVLCAVVGATAVPVPLTAFGADAEPVAIHVQKLETCTCCRPWIRYLQSEGFKVTSEDVPNLDSVREARGIPQPLGSCHTAEVDGYLIEGHVPAEDIRRLLAERPKIKLLAVPNMPVGPPGMDGPGAKPYEVIAL